MNRTKLKPTTVDKLKDLVRVNADSAEGFRTAASAVKNPTLASMFRKYATERASQAQELRDQVGWSQTDSEQEGSFKGQVHRWWIDLRGKLSDGDEHAILAEAERGEDSIKKTYEDVILETTGSPVNDLLHAQMRKVKEAHDKVRDLRDTAKRNA